MRRILAIDTERLRVRPYRESDLDALHRLWTDPGVRRYLWDDKIITRQVAADTMHASMVSTAEHGFGHWAVCQAGADALIGFCGLSLIDETPDVELLYGLAPAHWHRGLASEAGRAVLRFGFESIRLERVYAITDAPNTASAAVMRRLGMRFEKRFTHHGLDSVRYVMARAEFRPRDERYAVQCAGLETERLHLRTWSGEDFEALRRLTADPEVMRYISVGAPWSGAQTRAFIDRQIANAREHGFCLWALQEKASGELIGQTGLQYLGTSGEVEIGWWLRRDRWGRGLATEAAHAALRFAFEGAGLKRVVAIANPANRASHAIMEKIGLRFVRAASSTEFGLGDVELPCVLYAMTKREYES
jgi:RimJ/RimL family protein N-acetyltransferase